MSTDLEKRKNWLRWLISVICLIFIVNLSRGIFGLLQARQRVRDTETQLRKLQEEKRNLEGELKYQLSEDYAEREIRDKLNMAKPGEVVVILPEITVSPRPLIRVGNEGSKDQAYLEPNWKKWLKVLGF